MSDIETVQEALADYYSDWTELEDPKAISALDRIIAERDRYKKLAARRSHTIFRLEAELDAYKEDYES